jgi:hypothetical protein
MENTIQQNATSQNKKKHSHLLSHLLELRHGLPCHKASKQAQPIQVLNKRCVWDQMLWVFHGLSMRKLS